MGMTLEETCEFECWYRTGMGGNGNLERIPAHV